MGLGLRWVQSLEGFEGPGRTGVAVMIGRRTARVRVVDDSRRRMAIAVDFSWELD